jgi:hypothetical protein
MIVFLLILVGFYFLYLNNRVSRNSLYDDGHVSEYGGCWVNQAKNHWDEDWVWVENAPQNTYWISVIEQDGSYQIIVDMDPKSDAIEHLDCHSDREIASGIGILKAYYGTFGPVTIQKQFEREDQ